MQPRDVGDSSEMRPAVHGGTGDAPARRRAPTREKEREDCRVFAALLKYHVGNRSGRLDPGPDPKLVGPEADYKYKVWLAKKVGVSRRTLDEYLKATTKPVVGDLAKWEAVLGVTPGQEHTIGSDATRLQAAWELKAALSPPADPRHYCAQEDARRAKLASQFSDQLAESLGKTPQPTTAPATAPVQHGSLLYQSPIPARTGAPLADATAQALRDLLNQWRCSPSGGRPTPFEVLDRRRQDLQRALGTRPWMDAQELAWIPPGWVRMPDRTVLEVQRPVAMMRRLVSGLEAGMAPDGGGDVAKRAAHGVSRDDAKAHAARLNAGQPDISWRLPTLAEWWMALTAGRARLPDPGSSGGPWLDVVPANEWRFHPAPPEMSEWVTASPGNDGFVVRARGECRAVRADERRDHFWFRLVLDWLAVSDEPVQRPR